MSDLSEDKMSTNELLKLILEELKSINYTLDQIQEYGIKSKNY